MTSNKLLFSANMDSDQNDEDITVEVDDNEAAVYDCRAYVGKVLKVDEFESWMSTFPFSHTKEIC